MNFNNGSLNIEKELSEYINSLSNNQKEHIIYYAQSRNIFETGDLDVTMKNFSFLLSKRIANTHKEESYENMVDILNDLLSKCLNAKHYEFLEDDDLASLFCYVHLLNNNVFSIYDDLIFFNSRGTLKAETFNFRDHTSLKTQTNIKTMKYDFINFINSIQCNHHKKVKYVNYLNGKFSESKISFNFRWLNNRRQQELWALEYISKQDIFKKKFKHLPAIFSDKKNSFLFIEAMFHALEISASEKKLILINMKKAWGQVKYRNKIKNEDKVTLNVVVDRATSQNLKLLSEEFDMPVNRIISMMSSKYVSKVNELKDLKKQEEAEKNRKFNNLI